MVLNAQVMAQEPAANARAHTTANNFKSQKRCGVLCPFWDAQRSNITDGSSIASPAMIASLPLRRKRRAPHHPAWLGGGDGAAHFEGLMQCSRGQGKMTGGRTPHSPTTTSTLVWCNGRRNTSLPRSSAEPLQSVALSMPGHLVLPRAWGFKLSSLQHC